MDGKNRLVKNVVKHNHKEAERDGAALSVLSSILLKRPVLIGATSEKMAREVEATIKRANEVAVCLGYPEDLIKSAELRTGGGGQGISDPPLPGGFMGSGGDPNTVH